MTIATRRSLYEYKQDIKAVIESDYPNDIKLRDIMDMLQEHTDEEVYQLRCYFGGVVAELEKKNDNLSTQVTTLRRELSEVKHQRVKHLKHELEVLGVNSDDLNDHRLDTRPYNRLDSRPYKEPVEIEPDDTKGRPS